MIRALLAAAALAGLSACLHDDRTPVDRGAAGIFETTQEIQAPNVDRCQRMGKSSIRGQCDDAKYLAQKYVRALSTGDQVCLEGGFGDAPGAACLARATVRDAGSTRVMLHVADTQPGSRWFKYIGIELWFQEGALVDLYLADRGY